MKFVSNLIGWFDGEPDASLPDLVSEFDVNPANGLPMIEGTGIDIEGNPFGTDSHVFDTDSIGTGFDDCNNQSIFD
jgi:hypothetical protein